MPVICQSFILDMHGVSSGRPAALARAGRHQHTSDRQAQRRERVGRLLSSWCGGVLTRRVRCCRPPQARPSDSFRRPTDLAGPVPRSPPCPPSIHASSPRRAGSTFATMSTVDPCTLAPSVSRAMAARIQQSQADSCRDGRENTLKLDVAPGTHQTRAHAHQRRRGHQGAWY